MLSNTTKTIELIIVVPKLSLGSYAEMPKIFGQNK